ncbi:hypothetical protein BFL43_18705, partial [Williamsia sp. 1135]
RQAQLGVLNQGPDPPLFRQSPHHREKCLECREVDKSRFRRVAMFRQHRRIVSTWVIPHILRWLPGCQDETA